MQSGGEPPRVSFLVPARNEVDVIGQTVGRLLAQEYAGPFEVLVLDDSSTDGTADAARIAAGSDPRMRLLTGVPLPAGWTGKNWACQQLAQQARGDLLVFTDADIAWGPEALAALVQVVDQYKADVLTVWPTQKTVTWSERLVVPLMMFAIMAYLPETLVRLSPWPAFAAANGQCLAFRRAAYERLGGHQAVRQNVVEDVALARLVKRGGLRLVMALGDRLISGRMYGCWREVREGFAKNILAGHGGQPLLLLLSGLFHWGLFLVPWLWLALGVWVRGPGWPEVPGAMAALGMGALALSSAATRQRAADALGLPVSVLMMTVIAAQSVYWHFRYGGPRWKGRQIEAQVKIA